MMMTLDVTHPTFPHHCDLDLDLHPRPDLDRSAAGKRRLRSTTESMTSSSRDHQSAAVATSHGPFTKLKVDHHIMCCNVYFMSFLADYNVYMLRFCDKLSF